MDARAYECQLVRMAKQKMKWNSDSVSLRGVQVGQISFGPDARASYTLA